MGRHLIIILSLVFIGLSAHAASAQGRGAMAQAQRITGDRFAFSARTPRGANVYAVRQPSRAMLSAIDRGLGDLFAAARRNGYGRLVNYADYTIYIARPDRTRNSQGGYSPDIAVGSAQYAGSVYDQGGYIWAAGMVVANSPASFVIADHTQELNRVSDVVRYEGEHLVLYHNDRRRYSQTMDHSAGGGHPILQ